MAKITISNFGKRLKILSDDIVLFEKVRQSFAVKNLLKDLAEKAIIKKSKGLITPKLPEFFNCISPVGSFNPGLWVDIISKYKLFDKDLKIEIEPKAKSIIQPFVLKEPIEYFFNKEYEERECHKKAIDLALKYGRGVFELPTGIGKSFIIYSILKNLLKLPELKHYLILVPSLQLVTQLYKDFIDYGLDKKLVQQFSSFTGNVNKNIPIIIANRQWLQVHSKELPYIDVLFVDECHCAKKENIVTKFIKSLETNIKYGFSGTIPKDVRDRWSVIGNIGPLLCSEKASTFQSKEDGILSPLNIIAIKFKHGLGQPQAVNDESLYNVEYNLIEGSKSSNINIGKIAHKLNNNTIVMFDHTSHGKALFRIIEELNDNLDKRCFFINGETELDHREDVRKYMETENNVILIANTACFSVGINIKNVHNIIFAISGKAETKIIQSIGRSLRKLNSKNTATLIDIYHDFKYSINHFEQRRLLYKENYAKDVDKHYEVSI